LNQIKYKKYEGCDLIENYSKLYYTTLIILLALLISPAHASPDIITGSGYTTGTGEGWYTHYSFINYCPMCDHYNCLERGLKRNDEISCYQCGADYSFSGKEKLHRPRAWLTPYVPEPEPSVPETVPPPLTPWQKAHTCFKNNQII
jgi:hypothetical protein